MHKICVPVQMKLGDLRAAADYLASRMLMIDGKEIGFRFPSDDEHIEGVTEVLLITDGQAVSENENWVVEFFRRP